MARPTRLPPIDLARLEALIPRYATAGPRYTSYPTAPTWTEDFGPEAFREALGRVAPGSELSVYVHVPFCRSLCHFCACNRVITRDPERPPARPRPRRSGVGLCAHPVL